MSRLGRARHTLRNPLTEILGFSEILQDDANERSLEGLVPGLKSIHQAASVLLSEVNHYLNPDTLGANPDGTRELESTVDRLGEEILRTAESLSWKCDELGTSAIGDDLLRITGAARRLRRSWRVGCDVRATRFRWLRTAGRHWRNFKPDRLICCCWIFSCPR